MNDTADQPLSSILTGDSDHLHSFHVVTIKNDVSSFRNDLTVVVNKNVRTVTVSTAANAATVSPGQKHSVDIQSGMPKPDSGEVGGQKPLSKVLDTAALAAALPSANSAISGSAFAGYNFSTAFSKSETGQSSLKYLFFVGFHHLSLFRYFWQPLFLMID